MLNIATLAASTVESLESPVSAKAVAAALNSNLVSPASASAVAPSGAPTPSGKKKVDRTHLAKPAHAYANADKLNEGVNTSIANLKNIYNDHKKRVNWSFSICIAGSILVIALLLWLIFSATRSDSSLKLIVTLVISLLSGTLFWIYKTEQGKMEAIEKDIQKLEVLKIQLILLSGLDDKENVVNLLEKLK